MWGEPVPISDNDGQQVNLLFFDTEGFESTGKADVYDDRIFALSTLISSVLIYNLPETIRESDVEKLSFASELAKAFYPTGSSQTQTHLDQNPPISPGSMIWLIQRDFLQGSTLSTTLKNALKQVPNPHNDPGILQLNRIRQGLAAIASNSTALGLPQPHINRTQLCDLPDEALDGLYLQRREQLKALVRGNAKPKMVKGKPLDGNTMADLIQEVVQALNAKEIPTSGSLVEYFNRELVNTCRDIFIKMIEKQRLPAENSTLMTAIGAARDYVLQKFEKERFGAATEDLHDTLQTTLQREIAAKNNENAYKSGELCEQAELQCETDLERAALRLPSTGRFREHFEACKAKFDVSCVGPAKEHNADRLQRVWERESARFFKEYNERLMSGLVIASIACIIVFRFVIKITLAESVGWLAFVFLQVYPKTYIGSSSSMYDSSWWQSIVNAWEFVVDNPLIDFDRYGVPLVVFMFVLYATRRRWIGKLSGVGKRKKGDGLKDLDV